MQISLLELSTKKHAKVIEIQAGANLIRRLESMGIRVGSRIIRLPSAGGPVVIKIGTTQLAIGRGMAAKVIVEDE